MVGLVNDEWDRFWKETVVAYWRYSPGPWRERTEEIYENLIQNIRWRRDSNRGPLEYGSKELPLYQLVRRSRGNVKMEAGGSLGTLVTT
jgi:hypothetical protein